MRLILRVHTTCCHSLKVTHLSSCYKVRQGLSNLLWLRVQVLKVVRTAVVKTGCLCVCSRDRCAKQTTSEKPYRCQGIHSLGLLLSNKKLFIHLFLKMTQFIHLIPKMQQMNGTALLYIFSLYIFIYNTFLMPGKRIKCNT